MLVNTFSSQDDLQISEACVQAIVETVIHLEHQTCDEVSIYFVNTEEICQLHDEFFEDPSPTDCISFPMDCELDETPYLVLGEVFVCPATAIEYAKREKVDPYEETTLYIIHGLLHLMGYEDLEEEDIVKMREAESRHLHHIKKLNLVLKP